MCLSLSLSLSLSPSLSISLSLSFFLSISSLSLSLSLFHSLCLCLSPSLSLYLILSHSLPFSLSLSLNLFHSLSLCVSALTAKVIDKAALAKDDEESLHSEVAILQKLSHKNIVTCSDFFSEEKHYYLVLEYMEGGELFDRIVKKSYYNEKEARDVVYTLLSAIEYCHSHNIVHRYVQTNVLLRAYSNVRIFLIFFNTILFHFIILFFYLPV